MFQFARFPSHALGHGWLCIITAGFLHSDVCGSPIICISPQLFAACHVLRRQISPRHPPYALSILTYVFYLDFCFFLARRKVSLSPSFLQYARKFFSFVKSFLSFLLLYSFQRTVSRLVCRVGGDEENRTPDPLLARQVLSQLSYAPLRVIMLLLVLALTFSVSFGFSPYGLKWTRTTDLTLIRRAL